MRILFIHAAWPNQFSPLHIHFQETGLAESWMLVTEQDRNFYQARDPAFPKNVISYEPDGETGKGYYFSGIPERNARHGVRILEACKRLLATQPIDLIVAHGVLGPPQMLFDEVDIPIISYVEYPSFRHHRWDPQYPPQDGQRYCDKYDEMLNYYAALKSARTITPSEYARRMFPPLLQPKIVARMEAFDPRKLSVNEPAKLPFKKEPGLTYVGFAASSLSSEKGLEKFIAISKELSKRNANIRYVLIGDPQGVGYCYEYIHLEAIYGKDSGVSFKDYLLKKYRVNEWLYIATGRLDPVAFSTAIHHVDFFLYPLQFGSANWGIYEILLRGKVVIGSNRCFVPELITDGENGFLVDYDDMERWVSLSNDVAMHPEKYKPVAGRAAASGEKLHIANVAQDYLRIFEDVLAERKAG